LLRIAKCSCGALRAEANGDPEAVSVCHCLEYQRRTGSAFGVAAFFAREAVRFFGECSTYARAGDAGRKVVFRFCALCGSTLWWETERFPGRVALAMGAFADPAFPWPVRSFYQQTRHRWVDLPRDIPAHAAGRDSPQIAR
jgi:hypothetical protein